MRSWLFALALCAACGKNEKPPPPSNVHLNQESGPPSKRQPPSEAAQAYFAQTCALCHGADGSGNGPMAAQLNPKPRNYTDPAWQTSVSDDEIRKIIVQGGQAVGKSNLMPPNPELQSRPEMLDGLVKIIRGFAKK